MAGLYGNPQKYVRHTTDDTYTIEPQRYQIIPFWNADTGAVARQDGQDLTTKTMPLGSKITQHKIAMTVTPSSIEPQNIYIGTIKLSFNDCYSPYVAGVRYTSATTHTPAVQTSYLNMFPVDAQKRVNIPVGDQTATFNNIRLDDFFKHWVKNLKKVTVFDQQPLISDREMNVPSKVKRINEFTFYGLWVYNDAPRGAVPADTQVLFRIQQYIEEYAL